MDIPEVRASYSSESASYDALKRSLDFWTTPYLICTQVAMPRTSRVTCEERCPIHHWISPPSQTYRLCRRPCGWPQTFRSSCPASCRTSRSLTLRECARIVQHPWTYSTMRVPRGVLLQHHFPTPTQFQQWSTSKLSLLVSDTQMPLSNLDRIPNFLQMQAREKLNWAFERN